MLEKEAIDREFKASALVAPEFTNKGPRVPDYDFSQSVFSKDPFGSSSLPAF